MENEEKYNFIFNQIVENYNDFVGSMAYVLYKRNKIEFIEKYKEEHDGKEPELSELREWQRGECVSSKLTNYKKLAEQKANEFVNNLQGEKERELASRKTELDRRESALKEKDRQVCSRETDVAKREKDLTKKENDVKKREYGVKSKEQDINKRDKYCHVKSHHWTIRFLFGMSQSLVASIVFVLLGYFFIFYINKDTDVLKALSTKQSKTPEIKTDVNNQLPIDTIIVNSVK